LTTAAAVWGMISIPYNEQIVVGRTTLVHRLALFFPDVYLFPDPPLVHSVSLSITSALSQSVTRLREMA